MLLTSIPTTTTTMAPIGFCQRNEMPCAAGWNATVSTTAINRDRSCRRSTTVSIPGGSRPGAPHRRVGVLDGEAQPRLRAVASVRSTPRHVRRSTGPNDDATDAFVAMSRRWGAESLLQPDD